MLLFGSRSSMRTRSKPLRRVRVVLWVCGALLLLVVCACRKHAPPPDGGVSPRVIAAPALPPDAGAAPEIQVLNARRFGVQIFASQDAQIVDKTQRAFAQHGLRGERVEVDLGERGRWWRLILGSFGSRQLAELAAQRWSLDAGLKKIWPPVPAGEAPYLIREDLPPLQVAPRAAFAVAASVGSHRYQAALLQAPGAPLRWLLLAVQGDVRLRPIDAAGAVLQPLPPPSYPHCADCVSLASSARPLVVAIEWVADVDGQQGDELLARYRYKEFDLGSLIGWRKGRPAELAGFVLDNHQQTTWVDNTLLRVELDGDPGLELLHISREAVVHEGDLCDLAQTTRAMDLGGEGATALWVLPPVGALGELHTDATRSFWNLAATLSRQPAAAPLIVELAWLAAQPLLVTDAKAQAELGRRLQLLKGPQAWRWRIEALAQLVSVRSSFAVTQVLAVLESLNAALEDPSIAVSALGCDQGPLAAAGTWASSDLSRLMARAPSRRDLRSLSLRAWQGLASRYAPSTPVGQALQGLADKLRPASAHHRRVIEAMRRGRSARAGLPQ